MEPELDRAKVTAAIMGVEAVYPEADILSMITLMLAVRSTRLPPGGKTIQCLRALADILETMY